MIYRSLDDVGCGSGISVMKIIKSSTYNAYFIGRDMCSQMSLISNIHNIGLSTYPCGTPLTWENYLKNCPVSKTFNVRFDENCSMKKHIFPLISHSLGL